MLKVFVRLIADAAFVAVLLFLAAGTLSWWRAWALVAVLLAVRFLSAAAVYRVSPALLVDRAKLPIHRDQPATDRLLVLAVLGTGFLALPVIAGWDVFHWQTLARPTPFVSALGLLLFVLGWGIKGLALSANAFATSVVRLQTEREHVVVDAGVCRIVRHPFYVGTPLVLLGQGLWLESYVAALCAIVPTGLVVIRLVLEERYLHRALPGYSEYGQRVPYRLLPGIW